MGKKLSELTINCHKITQKSRLKLLGEIMNNFYREEINYKKIDNPNVEFYYLTNGEGMSILEIDRKEKEYRHARFDDFSGDKFIPMSHIEKRDKLFSEDE